MPERLLEINDALDGVRGVKSEGGSARIAAATSLVGGLGGRIESLNLAFSGTDASATVEMPTTDRPPGNETS